MQLNPHSVIYATIALTYAAAWLGLDKGLVSLTCTALYSALAADAAGH